MPGEEAGRRASSDGGKAQGSGGGRPGRAGGPGAAAAGDQLGGPAAPALQPRRGRRAAGGREGERDGGRAAAWHYSSLAARVEGSQPAAGRPQLGQHRRARAPRPHSVCGETGRKPSSQEQARGGREEAAGRAAERAGQRLKRGCRRGHGFRLAPTPDKGSAPPRSPRFGSSQSPYFVSDPPFSRRVLHCSGETPNPAVPHSCLSLRPPETPRLFIRHPAEEPGSPRLALPFPTAAAGTPRGEAGPALPADGLPHLEASPPHCPASAAPRGWGVGRAARPWAPSGSLVTSGAGVGQGRGGQGHPMWGHRCKGTAPVPCPSVPVASHGAGWESGSGACPAAA